MLGDAVDVALEVRQLVEHTEQQELLAFAEDLVTTVCEWTARNSADDDSGGGSGSSRSSRNKGSSSSAGDDDVHETPSLSEMWSEVSKRRRATLVLTLL